MSQRIRQYLAAILAVILVGGVVYSLAVFVRAAIRGITSLNSSIAVAIIAAGGTVVVSVLSVVLGKIYESRSLIRKEHRERKIPVYEDLIKFTFKVLMSTKSGTPTPEKEMIDFMMDFNQRLMVWGSDEILAAWVKWRRLAADEVRLKAQPMKLMFLYEELILAIRRDLGHRNKNIATGDVLALFVNDIDQYLPTRK